VSVFGILSSLFRIIELYLGVCKFVYQIHNDSFRNAFFEEYLLHILVEKGKVLRILLKGS
jgi:hypothetical protein